jgi:hypothetical protein
VGAQASSFTTQLSFRVLSFHLPLSNMPRSKKGRLSGSARKEINERRAGDIVGDVITAYRRHAADPSKPLVLGDAAEIAFARITKMTGANHVRVAVDTRHGPKELIARIPNVYARRGSTPITTRDVVTIYVGEDFDANTVDASASGVHFDITSVLSHAQMQQLKNCGAIPEWMARDEGAAQAGKGAELGFEFDYGGIKEEGESDSDDSEPAAPSGFSRKTARMAVHAEDDGVDVDAI